MTDQFGACVVLVPSHIGLPIHESVAGGHHITLAYLGDTNVDAEMELELIQLTASIMNRWDKTITLYPTGIDRFGEDADAVVLTFSEDPESHAHTLRDQLLDEMSYELKDRFIRSQTFPDFKPHMTLGYISKGYDPEDSALVDIPTTIHIEGMSVWNGESRTLLQNRHDDTIMHYGILRKSGRYPWGSGDNPYQRSMAFYSAYNQLKSEGLSDVEISKLFGEQSTPKADFNTKMLRVTRTQAFAEKRAGDKTRVLRMRKKGMLPKAIAEALGDGYSEARVRNLLKDSEEVKVDATKAIADKLREQITDTHYLDVGKGNENRLGVSPERLSTAVAILRDEGYELMFYKSPQLGTNHDTTIKFLAPPGSKGKIRIKDYPERIGIIDFKSEDNGLTFLENEKPKPLSSKRVEIAYGEDGGGKKDGIIELRRGVKDLDIGGARYAQVRVNVDDTHYLKGVAVYADDLPDGVDVRFNTPKSKTSFKNKKDAFKPLKETTKGSGEVDWQNPFGAQIKAGGQRGVLNIVNEEGDWAQWSNKLSSQMLSKQPVTLAQKQLDYTREMKEAEFEEIRSLTNPAVKKILLESFADNTDSNAVTLKALSMPRTTNKVILPVPSLKENEVYAPTFKDGETVVLIRHPHGGRFEIPQLKVNNRSRNAKAVMGDAIDAIGINPKTAEQLSGADFDGDTVLIIPQKGEIKRSNPLKQLENFDPKEMYPEREGMKYMTKAATQNEMGRISNLINDMTIIGANESEIAEAVRHSMVVIDAEKHKLDYKQSEIDNRISSLKAKYQTGGASTIISRASSDYRPLDYRDARVSEGGPINPKTGEKVYVETGKTRTEGSRNPDTGVWEPKMVKDPKTGDLIPKVVPITRKTTKMAYAKDARTLMSTPEGQPIERTYANYANEMKALANKARLEFINTPNVVKTPSAAKVYAAEVESLRHHLNLALQNAPLERRAQIVGNAILKERMDNNPDMDADEIKKARSKALNEARLRVGANKHQIPITPREWEAIQAGALSNNLLTQVLKNTDLDMVKEYATPRENVGLPPAALSRARAMRNAGHTWAEISGALGYAVSTLSNALQ